MGLLVRPSLGVDGVELRISMPSLLVVVVAKNGQWLDLRLHGTSMGSRSCGFLQSCQMLALHRCNPWQMEPLCGRVQHVFVLRVPPRLCVVAEDLIQY
jgi:hypothetical protein